MENSKFDVTRSKICSYTTLSKRYNVPKIGQVIKIILDNDSESELNLEEYGIESAQFQIIFQTFCESPFTNLSKINLKNESLDFYCCQALGIFISNCSTLKELNFKYCQIEDFEGAKTFANALKVSTSIKNLTLKNCGLDDNSGAVIIAAFKENSVCEDLDLSCNLLAFNSSKSLEQIFMKNETLKIVNLSRNSLNLFNAAVNVIRGLGFNDSIINIDLSWNGLRGKDFGKILVKSLKKSKIVKLNLENNLLGGFEIKKLTTALKKSKTIEKVCLGGVQFPGELDAVILSAFKAKNDKLRILSFGKWFELSTEALRILSEIQLKKPDIEVIWRNTK